MRYRRVPMQTCSGCGPVITNQFTAWRGRPVCGRCCVNLAQGAVIACYKDWHGDDDKPNLEEIVWRNCGGSLAKAQDMADGSNLGHQGELEQALDKALKRNGLKVPASRWSQGNAF